MPRHYAPQVPKSILYPDGTRKPFNEESLTDLQNSLAQSVKVIRGLSAVYMSMLERLDRNDGQASDASQA